MTPVNDPAPRLGLWATTALVATQAIGVGIFLTPAIMARSLRSPLAVFAVWALMGAMAGSGGWCFGRLAARYPQSGGAYVYLREVYGPVPAFLFGWMSFWVMDVGVMAALSAGAASYIAFLHPMGGAAQRLLAAALPAAIGLAFLLAPAAALRSLSAANLLKVALVAGAPLWILLSGHWRWSRLWVPPRAVPWTYAGAATVGAFFAMAGWWEATKIAERVRDPERTLPRALGLGITAIVALYLLLTAGLLALIPLRQLATGPAFLAQVGLVLAGPWGARLLAGLVVFCVAAALGSLLLTTPAVYQAMHRDGLFPAVLARPGRGGWPARITGVQLLMIAALTLTGTFTAIAAYPVFSAVLFIALTAAGVQFLPGQTRGRRWIPVLFLALSLLVLAPVLAHFRHALAGLAITLLGWPVYRLRSGRWRAVGAPGPPVEQVEA